MMLHRSRAIGPSPVKHAVTYPQGTEKGPDTMRCRGLRVFVGAVLWVTKLYGVGHRYLPVGLMEDPQVD